MVGETEPTRKRCQETPLVVSRRVVKLPRCSISGVSGAASVLNSIVNYRRTYNLCRFYYVVYKVSRKRSQADAEPAQAARFLQFNRDGDGDGFQLHQRAHEVA